jgi:hypothetical protein
MFEMTAPTNLNSFLLLDQVDNAELTQVLSLYFRFARSGLRGMNPKSTNEFHSYNIAMDLAREALLNWLMKRTGGWSYPAS